MATTTYPFLFPGGVMGLPLQNSSSGPVSGKNAVMNASRGGDECFQWVYAQGLVSLLAGALPSSAPTNGSSPYGDYRFAQTFQTSKNGPEVNVLIQSTTTLQEDVVSGSTPPTTYDYNGTDYNIIGSIEQVIAYNNVSAWTITVPLMLAGSVPISALAGVAWKTLLSPAISKLYQGIKSALTTDAEDLTTDAAVEAAADTAAEVATEVGIEVAEDATIDVLTGGLATIGFIGLIAVQIGIDMLIHPSYHQLLIYNFTEFNVQWGAPDLEKDTIITLQPVVNTTGNVPQNTLPAVSQSSPSPWIASVETASMAQFNVYSNSEVDGAKWGLSFTLTDPTTNSPVSQPVAAMWDIPLGSSNSIGLGTNVSQGQLHDWVKDQEGKNKVTYLQQTVNAQGKSVTVSNSIDYLHDKHPMAPGSNDTGYIYRSVLIFGQ